MMKFAVNIMFLSLVKGHGKDFVCPNGDLTTSETIYVGKGESYSLTFKTKKKTKCKVIYKPVNDDETHETCCKTGLRFTCSEFYLPNKDPRLCRSGAKLTSSVSGRPFCKRESPKIKTKGRLALAFSSTSKAKAQCKIECRDKDVSPIVLPPINLEDLLIPITTPIPIPFQDPIFRVYGPWSDERLSAFEFMVSTDGLASFGFSPCYNCDLAYQFKIGGGSENKDISIFVDGVLSASETALFNPLSSSSNTTIRIQTFPLRDGPLQLIVDAFEDGTGSSSNQFNTTADPLPFGITYAVFGDTDIATTANYFFRDVDRLPKIFPLADCREGYNTGFTVETDDTVSILPLNIADPVGISNVHPSQLWCIVETGETCPCGAEDRNHIELSYRGQVRHMGTCKYLRAGVPTDDNGGLGDVTLVSLIGDATVFEFVEAPNTEIKQIRFDDTKYVLAWENMASFASGSGLPKAKNGTTVNPLESCFKKYNFLSNVLDEN